MDFFAQLFRFREAMLGKFPGESRRKWYDPEDAFSDVTLETYEEAVKGDLKVPPEKDNWIGFLRARMRKEVLSSKQQAVFFATAQDMTHEEAARCAGTTPGAARVHAERAEKKMRKLRERLKRTRVA
jgi:DNA-directed RNA polymerase specialized sigma24 family protein